MTVIGPPLSVPDKQNDYQEAFVRRVVGSYARITGGNLLSEAGLNSDNLGFSAFTGNFALLTHRGDPHALLNYGNDFALRLWECDWNSFTAMPSSATAPDDDRPARDAAMKVVAEKGFVKGHTGRRISRTGRLFLIKNVTIWRLLEPSGQSFGVAAFFQEFERL